MSKSSKSTTVDKVEDLNESTLNTLLKPTYLLFGSCIPLFLGAYAGYKSEVTRATSSKSLDTYSPGFTSSGSGLLKRVISEELVTKGAVSTSQNAATKLAVESTELVHVNVPRVAFKALGIGSLLSIGGFGLLTLAVFKATGSNDLDELIEKCRRWTPKKRIELENRFGINPKSMQHEDIKATKGMTEDEEWEFLKKKYIPELVDEGNKKNSS